MSIFIIKKPDSSTNNTENQFKNTSDVKQHKNDIKFNDQESSFIIDNGSSIADVVHDILQEKLALQRSSTEISEEQLHDITKTNRVLGYYYILESNTDKSEVIEKVDNLIYKYKFPTTVVIEDIQPTLRTYIESIGCKLISKEQFALILRNNYIEDSLQLF